MALVTLQRSPSPSNDPEEESAEGGEDGTDGRASLRHKSLSESYFTIKGAALILPHSDLNRKTSRKNHGGEIQRHLQAMLYLLRPEDKIKVAIRLEGLREGEHRYMALVSTMGRQDTEESVILGLDCSMTLSAALSPPASPKSLRSPTSPATPPSSPMSPSAEGAMAGAAAAVSHHGSSATIGLVLPIWMGMKVRLSGDGGFSISLDEKSYLFKPVSVQAMWSAIQSLNKALHQAEQMKYLAEGLSHTWVQYYHSKVDISSRSRLTTWNLMEDVEVFAPACLDFKGENESEKVKMKISAKLKEVMMSVDLDEATSLSLRKQVEEALDMKLDLYRSYFDEELIRILGQMDAPSQILPFLYLGSEWNASNLEELQKLGIKYILNVTREIDNFFTGMFHYYNVRLYDVEDSELLKHWPKTHKFIDKAKKHGSKILVHCKMGVSRSASTVIAYVMKENQWPLEKAFDFVKERRSCIRPNKGFMEQLHTYEGILQASRKRLIFRSVSEQNVEEGDQTETADGTQQGTFLGESLFQQMSQADWPNQNLSPEEEILLRKGYTGDRDITAMEPDFETDSRSADSMEESLPDMPSPSSEETTGFDLPIQEGATAISTDSRPRGTTKVTPEKNTQSGGPLKAAPDVLGDCHSTSRIKPDSSWIRLESPGESSTDPPVQEPMAVGGSHEQGQGAEFFIGSDNTQVCKTDVDAGLGPVPMSPPPKIVIEQAGETVEGPVDRAHQDSVEMGVHQYYSREQIPWSPGKVRNLRQGFSSRSSNSAFSDHSEKMDSRTSSIDIGDDERGLMSEAALLEAVGTLQTAPVMAMCDSCMELTSLDTGSEDVERMDGRPRSVYELEDIPLTPGTVRRTRQEIEERQRLYGDECDQGLYGLRSIQRSSSLRETRSSGRSRSAERRRTCTPILSPPSEQPTESSEELAFTTVLNLGAKIGESSTDDVEMETEGGVESTSEEPHPVTVYTFGEELVPVESGMVRRQKAEIESKGQGLHQCTLSAGSTGSLTNCDSSEPTGPWSPPQFTPPGPTTTTHENIVAGDAMLGLSASASHGVSVSRALWPSGLHHVHTDTSLASKHKDAKTSGSMFLRPLHTESSPAWQQDDAAGGMRPRAASDGLEGMRKSAQTASFEKCPSVSPGKGGVTKAEDGSGSHHGAAQCEGKNVGGDARPGAEVQSFVSRMEGKHDVSTTPPSGGDSDARRLSKEDPKLCSLAAAKGDSSKPTPQHPLTSPDKKQMRKSNIDPETLAMIREIGSAFISTPPKTEEEESRGGSTSLVKHLVKNIERQQKVPKQERKIIILDSGGSSSKRSSTQGKRRSQDIDVSTSPLSAALSSQQTLNPNSHMPLSSVPDSRRSPSLHGESGGHSSGPLDCGAGGGDERNRLGVDSSPSLLSSSPNCHSLAGTGTRFSEQQPSVVKHLVGRFETHSSHSDTSDGEQSLSGHFENSASALSASAAPSQHSDLVCDIPVLLQEREAVPGQGNSGSASKITKTRSLDDSSPCLRSESVLSSGKSTAGHTVSTPSQAPSHTSRRPRSAEQSSQYYSPGVRPHGVRQPWERETGEGGEEAEPKVRKLHGKSHPLSRLPQPTPRQGASPFNSTM